MWRNREVVRFLRWLRAENAERRVGHPRLDSTDWISTACIARWHRVIEYLDKVDPAAAQRARQGYACFDAFGEDVQRYGYAASLNIDRSCEDEVVEQLIELRRRAAEYARRDGRIAADEYSSPNRTPASSATPKPTTARCSGAAPNRGTCATGT